MEPASLARGSCGCRLTRLLDRNPEQQDVLVGNLCLEQLPTPAEEGSR